MAVRGLAGVAGCALFQRNRVVNHPFKWTLENLKYTPRGEVLKYIRDDLVEGIPFNMVSVLGSEEVPYTREPWLRDSTV